MIVVFSAWALLTDFFDGYLARKLTSITNAGKILDPLADKLCVVAAASAATIYGDMPLSLLVIIIVRDLAIAVFGLTIVGKVKKIPVSNLIGKITVTVLSATLVIYVFKIQMLYLPAFWIAMLFIAASSISYLKNGIKIISNKFEY